MTHARQTRDSKSTMLPEAYYMDVIIVQGSFFCPLRGTSFCSACAVHVFVG